MLNGSRARPPRCAQYGLPAPDGPEAVTTPRLRFLDDPRPSEA